MKGFTTRQLRFVFLIGLLLFSLMGLAAQAQEGMPPLPGELVIGDLPAPRGVSIGADGSVIVAVAGSGGDYVITMTGPEGEAQTNVGMSGRIISVAADGTVTPIIDGLPSFAAPNETVGIYRAIPQGDALWLVFTGEGAATNGNFYMDSVVELDATTMATRRIINLHDYETQNDPDGNGYDSNVADIAWLSDGTLLIVDAGCNCLLSWTEEAGLATVAVWPDNPVPTAIEVAADDSVYVSFLGAGLAPGAGKIEHWANGELVHTYEGLNAVTDILLDGDTLYAVQLVIFGEQGPGPGSVVMVSEDGVTPVAEGLLAPFGIAKGADGALYVSFGTLAFAPGMMGGVVRIEPGM